MKSRADVVVVGGGIIGCSLLYQLTRLGLSNVVLIEKSELTAGTTWHSAGHLVVLEENPAVARINALSFGIYTNFEKETGEAIGLHQCGSLQIAASRQRYDRLERLLPKMQALGHTCRMVSPEEMTELFPLLKPSSGLLGASWAPMEGYIDPSMATQAFARLARAAGAEIHRATRVTDLVRGPGGWRVETTAGAITADHVVLATGMWAPQLAAKVGIGLPIIPAERQYIVTDDMPEVEGLTRELPILRDYDAPLYFRQERKGLIMGVHEPHTPYCFVDGIPDSFGQELLEPDLDRGAACIAAGMELVPAFSRAGIKRVICGPTSRTIDFNGLMGPLWNHKNLHVLAGFSAGVGQGAGVARLMAEWIVKGEPSLDVTPIDVARFGPYVTISYMRECLSEAHTYGALNASLERAAGRPARTTPLYHRHRADGAVFVVRNGWECPAWFRTEKATSIDAAVAEESAAATRALGLADVSARTRLDISGPGAARVLAAVLGSEPPWTGDFAIALRGTDQPITVSVVRLGEAHYRLVASPETELRLLAVLQHEASAASDGIEIVNQTGRVGALLLAGPRAATVLTGVASRGFDAMTLDLQSPREVSVGFAPTSVRRLATKAGDAFEITTASDYLIGLDDVLRRAAQPEGVRDLGLRAVEALVVPAVAGRTKRVVGRPVVANAAAGLR
jgi:dimethylglycine dehydrogenase